MTSSSSHFQPSNGATHALAPDHPHFSSILHRTHNRPHFSRPHPLLSTTSAATGDTRMSVAIGQAEFLFPPSAIHQRSISSRQCHRAWKRRRVKPLTVHSHLNPTPSPFHNLFHSLLSQFPSVNSLSYIAPTLGFASGLALFFSYHSTKLLPYSKSIENPNSDIGEWILFTSPTPFNRFVTLRCPCIYFPENELLENVNEKLIKEDRHYVKLNNGRMTQLVKSDGSDYESMVYQRICVGTEDGGVLSLDWPANLDLEDDRGLDTTVLIVPGTEEGSNERKIRVFVCECLRRGVFPVVMNPRGCAGSPLTTARLFTAADSDDISTAVQYINKKRPWTTLMGVGWGYGANMLTKYLAESGDRTPLTAATCIDNPFDLEEVTRSSLYHMDFDRGHTDGLIKILQCNKGLFQGRGKRFDVEGALSASSIRDFESAISMLSYGCDTIEDFYAKCCTRDVVGKVKIPVLFIQNDDGKVPLFSIPRSLIAENLYTSLLLCSYSPSSKTMGDQPTFSWCQNLTLEWLTAVELGLLKGRHPLLNDVDVNINPSKGLALVESKASSKGERLDKFLNFTNGNYINPPLKMFETNDKATGIKSRSIEEQPPLTKGLHQEENNRRVKSSTGIDTKDEVETNSFDNERGHVLQSAEVVMNMLDMTMPDTLSDEQKKKVLNAVGQGTTLIKALQDAVPEDVRGKLTTAVAGILQTHGSNLKFGKLLSSGTRLRKANGDEEVHSLEQKRTNDPGDGSTKLDHSSNKSPRDTELENQSSESSQNPNDTGMYKSTCNSGSSGPDLENANQNDVGNSLEENKQLSGGSTAQISDGGDRSGKNADQESSRMTERSGRGDDIVADQKEVERGSGKGQSDRMEENSEHANDSSIDQNKVPGVHHTEDKSSAPSTSSETQMKENESENNQRKEEKGLAPISTENSGDPARFSVSQALDALTGFDDSTQVAVNSVFHVIEDMIDQLEGDKDNKNNASEIKELSEGSVSKNHLMKNEHEYGGAVDLRSNGRTQSGNADGSLLYDPAGSGDKNNQQHFEHEEHSNHNAGTRSQFGTENEISFVPAAGELPIWNSVKCLNSSSEKVLSYLTTFPYEDPLYREYLKRYLYLKMTNAKPLDKDKMLALYLDYIPEEGKWKLLEETDNNSASVDEPATHEGDYREVQTDTQPTYKHSDNIIEPSYVILDSGKPQDQNEELKGKDIASDNIGSSEVDFEDSVLFIKILVIECLNVEVDRRASAAEMEELKPKLVREMESVANALCIAARQGKLCMHKGNDNLSDKIGTLDGENIIKAIASAVQGTQYLRRILPVGVIVGASLASLRKFFNVAALDGSEEKQLPHDQVGNPEQKHVPVDQVGNPEQRHVQVDQVGNPERRHIQVNEKESSHRHSRKRESKDNITSSICEAEDDISVEDSKNNGVMVGAVTAALGASALLAHQSNTETGEASSESLKEKGNSKEPSKLDEMPGNTQSNIVASLAEKAMSVASPVVPIKEDGEVDHERLVATLAELGQKGGILKLVGKVALLWGGLRGAMSLTDKLISFLRIADRPLFQRILGFVSMVLLLWSPVILPLLPALMQSWTTHSPFKIAEFACIAGLYVSIMIMITLWGKGIRKYDDPLLQYGLDLASVPKFQNFLKGLIGGGVLVILIHTVNSLLGCAHLCWPTTLSSSSEPIALIKSYGRMLMLIVQGIATATGISVVEELLFRSWLTQEIAADFGYHHGVVASALVFAFSQRSAWEIPGLWLLSLSLSGAQKRSQGSLSLPIGLRAGILASNFILRTGGFLTYQPNFPLWITGGQPFQPFSGVVGLAFSLVLAVTLYPRERLYSTKTRVIRD